MKVKLNATIDSTLFKRIDEERGREKRSTFVEYLLRIGLKQHKLKETQNIV